MILTLLLCSHHIVVLYILCVKLKYNSSCTAISEFSLSCRILSVCHRHSSFTQLSTTVPNEVNT